MPAIVEATYRASPAPRARLPIGARSVGRHRVSGPWRLDAGKIKNAVQVFWGVSGAGWVKTGNRPCRIAAGDVAIYLPGEDFFVEVPSGRWECRWWTMDGPRVRAALEDFGLVGPWPRRAGACPTMLIESLRVQVREISPATEYAAAATAYQLLTLIATRLAHVSDEPSALVAQATAILQQEFVDSGLSVKRLAHRLSVHRSRLSREFQSRVGLSPKQYLSTLRLQKAVSLIQETNLRIGEIAGMVGFEDPAYLARCVVALTGRRPLELRDRWRKSLKGTR